MGRLEQLTRIASENLVEGNIEEAIRNFNFALVLDNNNSNVLNSLGLSYYHKGDFKEAEKYYKYALEMDPKNISSRIKLAETYLKLKKYDEASKEQIAILEKNPNNARARIGLGHSYLGLRRYDDSIREYKNALKQKRTPISPGWTGLLIINKYDREIKKYERRYQINTRKIEKFDIILAYDGLFDAHYEKGNYMKSLRCLFQVKGFKVKNKVANFLNSIMP